MPTDPDSIVLRGLSREGCLPANLFWGILSLFERTVSAGKEAKKKKKTQPLGMNGTH